MELGFGTESIFGPAGEGAEVVAGGGLEEGEGVLVGVFGLGWGGVERRRGKRGNKTGRR